MKGRIIRLTSTRSQTRPSRLPNAGVFQGSRSHGRRCAWGSQRGRTLTASSRDGAPRERSHGKHVAICSDSASDAQYVETRNAVGPAVAASIRKATTEARCRQRTIYLPEITIAWRYRSEGPPPLLAQLHAGWRYCWVSLPRAPGLARHPVVAAGFWASGRNRCFALL
jgi:hypothetical protein